MKYIYEYIKEITAHITLIPTDLWNISERLGRSKNNNATLEEHFVAYA